MTTVSAQASMMTPYEIERHVVRAIKKTINKFREHPYYFFTESDIVTYLCQSLYTRRLEAIGQDDRRIYLVHREYPTNFRYDKDPILEMDKPYDLSERKGKRGNFDLAVLNPYFVEHSHVKDIVNKNVRDLEARWEQSKDEVLVAIECKYIINNSRHYAEEINKDNKKLFFAKQQGVAHAINLVFCNIEPAYLCAFKKAVCSADDKVTAIFAQSYYDGNGKKVTPKPVVKRPDGAITNSIPSTLIVQLHPAGSSIFD